MTNEHINKMLAEIKTLCPYLYTEPEYDYWLAKNGYYNLLALLSAQGGL